MSGGYADRHRRLVELLRPLPRRGEIAQAAYTALLGGEDKHEATVRRVLEAISGVRELAPLPPLLVVTKRVRAALDFMALDKRAELVGPGGLDLLIRPPAPAARRGGRPKKNQIS